MSEDSLHCTKYLDYQATVLTVKISPAHNGGTRVSGQQPKCCIILLRGRDATEGGAAASEHATHLARAAASPAMPKFIRICIYFVSSTPASMTFTSRCT